MLMVMSDETKRRLKSLQNRVHVSTAHVVVLDDGLAVWRLVTQEDVHVVERLGRLDVLSDEMATAWPL